MKEKKRDWAISAGFLGVLLTAYVINYRFGFLEILDFHIEKVKKAYPAYFGTYDRMGGSLSATVGGIAVMGVLSYLTSSVEPAMDAVIFRFVPRPQ